MASKNSATAAPDRPPAEYPDYPGGYAKSGSHDAPRWQAHTGVTGAPASDSMLETVQLDEGADLHSKDPVARPQPHARELSGLIDAVIRYGAKCNANWRCYVFIVMTHACLTCLLSGWNRGTHAATGSPGTWVLTCMQCTLSILCVCVCLVARIRERRARTVAEHVRVLDMGFEEGFTVADNWWA